MHTPRRIACASFHTFDEGKHDLAAKERESTFGVFFLAHFECGIKDVGFFFLFLFYLYYSFLGPVVQT